MSDVEKIISDIIQTTSDIVFPTSNVIPGVFRKEKLFFVLRQLQGRMPYASQAQISVKHALMSSRLV